MNTGLAFSLQRIISAYKKLDNGQEKFKYILLYRAVKQCIEQQEIPNNWLIPSSRVLSRATGLSRTTVNTAYELLLLEKLIISKAGSGYRVSHKQIEKTDTFLNKKNTSSTHPELSLLGKSLLENTGRLNRTETAGIAFKPGHPPIDVFPINRWRNLLNTYWRHIKTSDLSSGQLYARAYLKHQLSDYLFVSRSIKVDPEQIAIVSGSLQSLYFIASALINRGDSVVLEDPTFPNVQSVFRSFGARLHSVAPDAEGICLDSLKELRESSPKVVHVTPSNHYPFGIKMSLQRRLSLLQWASKANSILIENDYEYEIGNSQNSIPTLFSLDKEERTIYLGTFNRLLYPSIRLGYMLLPRNLIPVMSALEEHSYRFVSPSLQMVMGQFIERNHLYRHLKNVTEAAQERLEVFQKEFNADLFHDPSSPNDFNSLHVLYRFPDVTNLEQEKEIIRLLAQKEISAFPYSSCFVNDRPQSGLIFGYATVMPVIMRQKIRQINEIFNHLIR